MEIVKAKQYYERLSAFINKHEIAKVETSSFQNGQWHKDYLCEDGSFGKEINRVVYEKARVEVKGLMVTVEIKLLETEWFDTDTGKSIYMYERY